MEIKEYLNDYLEKRAADDPQFAEKLKNNKKNIDECIKFIRQQAKKLAGNKDSIAVDNEEVLGWAVHYYDEENLQVPDDTAWKAAEPDAELTDEEKEEIREEAKKEALRQMIEEQKNLIRGKKKTSKPEPATELTLF
jgi:hypothetical protein